MDLVQMRFVDNGSGSLILQFRCAQPQGDASGAVCGFGEFGEWQTVPTEHVGKVSHVDSFDTRNQ